jgi:hypothetical protein
MKTACIVLFALAMFPVASNAAECWRAASDDELNQAWRMGEKTRFAQIEGDFNGQSKDGRAILAVSCDKKLFSVTAKVRIDDQEAEVHLSTLPYEQLPAYGISVAKPGRYQTVCSKKILDCANGQTAVSLSLPSILLSKQEGVRSILYWDKTAMEFRQAWLTD